MHVFRRTPTLILICGGLILTLSLGIRQGFGLFLQPMTAEFGWGRETFAFAIALQNLVWGAAQPFSGMIADRFGVGRVLAGGAALYALGLVLMALSSTGVELALSAGLLLGLGLSGTSYGVVFGVIGRTFAPEKRALAFGVASAAGSFGQFAMIPYGHALISSFGWYASLIILAGTAALMAPSPAPLPKDANMRLRNAAGNRSRTRLAKRSSTRAFAPLLGLSRLRLSDLVHRGAFAGIFVGPRNAGAYGNDSARANRPVQRVRQLSLQLFGRA